MSDVEKKVLAMFDKSKPVEQDLFETSHVNQIAWTLVVLFAGIIFWLCVALVNAENQRHALMTNQCEDPVFKGEVDKRCLLTVNSREHWWEHLWYAASNIRPENPDKKR